MRIAHRIAAVAAVTAALVAAGTAAAQASPLHRDATVGTVFVQTDAVDGNAIVAYDRLADGTLRLAGTYATGGDGLILAGSVVDHLASQSSLVREGSSLYAVNAGSDTITAFTIAGDRLVHRQVISSGAAAPVSIAASGHRVFVLNARDGGSIQGYASLGGHLVRVPAWHRTLGLDPDATPEFTHTPAQIAFTPDGSKLVVTTKANTSAIDVFAVTPFGLSATPAVTTLAGAVPFGFQFDRAGHAVVSEAGTNSVATFAIRRDGSAVQLDAAATGQAATCWIVVDGDLVYASNAGSGTLSGYRVASDGTLTALGTTATDAGTVDAAVSADGRYLYVQTGAAGTVDEFRVARDGALTRIGSVTVPGAVGGEGIVVR